MNEKRLPAAKSKKPFSGEEKVALILLTVIGFFGVVFGFTSFGSNLSRPFQIQLASYDGDQVLTISQQEAAEIARQKITDTDGDGLFDYDELEIYKTSPYLIDSDSDGVDDQTEVFSNQDPNCPKGKDCYGANSLTVNPEDSASDNSDQTISYLSDIFHISSPDLEGGIQSIDGLASFLSALDPDEIRSLLIAQGIPKETVDDMTDQEITDLLNQTLAQTEEPNESDSSSQDSGSSGQ